MVATAHLDTVWRWTIADTVEKFIPDTLSKNFDLIEKYPNYMFNFEGAYRYELIEEYYPRAFDQIRRYVKTNRWNPAGADFVARHRKTLLLYSCKKMRIATS